MAMKRELMMKICRERIELWTQMPHFQGLLPGSSAGREIRQVLQRGRIDSMTVIDVAFSQHVIDCSCSLHRS